MTLTRLSPEDLALARAREALGESRDVQRRRLVLLRRYAAANETGFVAVEDDEMRDFWELAGGGLISKLSPLRWAITGLGRRLLAQEGGDS